MAGYRNSSLLLTVNEIKSHKQNPNSYFHSLLIVHFAWRMANDTCRMDLKMNPNGKFTFSEGRIVRRLGRFGGLI